MSRLRFVSGTGDGSWNSGLRRGSSLPPWYGQHGAGERGVIHSLTVTTLTTLNPHDIDWADLAARARADLGDEPVERFSDRFRTFVMVTAETLRPGDTEDLRFGQSPAGRATPARRTNWDTLGPARYRWVGAPSKTRSTLAT